MTSATRFPRSFRGVAAGAEGDPKVVEALDEFVELALGTEIAAGGRGAGVSIAVSCRRNTDLRQRRHHPDDLKVHAGAQLVGVGDPGPVQFEQDQEHQHEEPRDQGGSDHGLLAAVGLGKLRGLGGVLKIDPSDVGANINLGQIYSQQRKYPEAIAAFRIAIGVEPYNGTALYNLGQSLMRGNQRSTMSAV